MPYCDLGVSLVAHREVDQVSGYQGINSVLGGYQTHQMLACLDQDVSIHQSDCALGRGFINKISVSEQVAGGQAKQYPVFTGSAIWIK